MFQIPDARQLGVALGVYVVRLGLLGEILATLIYQMGLGLRLAAAGRLQTQPVLHG